MSAHYEQHPTPAELELGGNTKELIDNASCGMTLALVEDEADMLVRTSTIAEMRRIKKILDAGVVKAATDWLLYSSETNSGTDLRAMPPEEFGSRRDGYEVSQSARYQSQGGGWIVSFERTIHSDKSGQILPQPNPRFTDNSDDRSARGFYNDEVPLNPDNWTVDQERLRDYPADQLARMAAMSLFLLRYYRTELGAIVDKPCPL